MCLELLYSGVVDDEVCDSRIFILVVALAVESGEQTPRSLFGCVEAPFDEQVADGVSVAVKLSGEEMSVGSLRDALSRADRSPQTLA